MSARTRISAPVASEVESFTWERRFRADAKRALNRIC